MHRYCYLTVGWLLAFATLTNAQEKKPAPLPIKEPAGDVKVEYAEVAKILRKNCLACHSGSKAENGLVMESPASMIKGGDSGGAIVPKKSAESLIFRLAAHIEDPVMPPKDNKVNAAALTPAELGLLKRWIDQGAEGQADAIAPLAWQPLPEAVSPIYAVAVSPDGAVAAAGRGNEVLIVETATGRTVARLVDPALRRKPARAARSPISTSSSPWRSIPTVGSWPRAAIAKSSFGVVRPKPSSENCPRSETSFARRPLRPTVKRPR
ncbi:MAG: hypothetical protein QM811_28915 [Pirellulales bacterium]